MTIEELFTKVREIFNTEGNPYREGQGVKDLRIRGQSVVYWIELIGDEECVCLLPKGDIHLICGEVSLKMPEEVYFKLLTDTQTSTDWNLMEDLNDDQN
jgi:hypothetical protein